MFFAIAAVVLAVVNKDRYSCRQKLTITEETLAGEVSGASVSAVRWRKQWIQADGMGWSHDLTGGREGRVIDGRCSATYRASGAWRRG